ncbi:hypothetical protein L3Y34_002781 [Caenorhabditis briggsae]|uniref:Uncharacterized protein n=1 Tax=Caenorhabditis briggsae TaxID=6238 RepID=A0AAE9ISK3_CAEBR|nr:hypothetical protein L3Y34_002781 [Caenorhabditis briggsae]
MDVEKQAKPQLIYTPTNTLKERFLEFLDYYFGPLKLYLFSYPMPDGLWDNRKLRLKASGVQVIPRAEPDPIVDRLIRIVQKNPAD